MNGYYTDTHLNKLLWRREMFLAGIKAVSILRHGVLGGIISWHINY